MAGLAVPVVEGLAEWLLPRLGIAIGGAILTDKVLEKDKANDDAKVDAVPRTRTRTCKQCPPDCGSLVTRNWNMSDVSRAYQAAVTGFVPGTEWNFEGTDFDGFRSAACRLEEAKAKYDQFFDEETGEPKTWWSGTASMLAEANRQDKITIASPPATLHWYFMQPLLYRYCTRQFASLRMIIQTELRPM